MKILESIQQAMSAGYNVKFLSYDPGVSYKILVSSDRVNRHSVYETVPHVTNNFEEKIAMKIQELHERLEKHNAS